MAKHPRPFALDHLDFPRFTEVPQPPRDFPATQKLEIGRIEYEAPNFISNGATQYNLAEALKRELEGLSFRDEVEYPDMLAPETEINVPFMTVKSQATDEEGLARDTVAEVKRELIKSANLFAKLHLMNYEKTGEWPEWYNKRWDPLYEEAILWQAPMFRGFEPPTGPIAELNMVDRAALMVAQLSGIETDMYKLEAMQQNKGWSDEDMDRMLPEFGLRKWKAAQENQETQDLGLLDKIAEVAKEGLEQVLDALSPEEAGAATIPAEDLLDTPGKSHKALLKGEFSPMLDGAAYGPFGDVNKNDRVKLRDSLSPQKSQFDRNVMQVNLLDFKYDPENLRRPWKNQIQIDFFDPETVNTLLRQPMPTPLQKMILDHQLHEAMSSGASIHRLDELQKLFKSASPQEWSAETLADFKEHIKLAEGFNAKAKRLDGEKGYTVGHGFYMPVDRAKNWTDSDKLNTLIREDPNNGDVTKISLTKEDAASILDQLVEKRIEKVEKLLPLLNYLNEVEQRVILDILYNMDFAKVKEFKNMFKNLLKGDRIEAGWELLDSKYSEGVGGRSLYNALMLATQKTTLDFEGYKDKWDKEKWASKSKPGRKEAYLKEVNRLLGK